MIKSIICRNEIPAITIMPACNKQAGIIYKKPTTYILVGIRRTHAYFTITFLTVPSDIFTMLMPFTVPFVSLPSMV